KTTEYRVGLAENYLNRGLALRDLGDRANAAAETRRAIALWESVPSRDGVAWFQTAAAHAALAGLAGKEGVDVSAADTQTEAAMAMTLLHKAVAMGYRPVNASRPEDALDPLRSRPDFQLLMLDLAFPAEPFSQDTDAHR